MSVRTNKSIYYHIPKTGGTWANRAIRFSMINNSDFEYKRPEIDYDNNYWQLLMSHSLGMKRAHETQWGISKKDKENLFSFTFVREPLDWYKSYWASARYMRDNESKMWQNSILHFALEDDFQGFIKNVTKMFPTGALTAIYKCFLGENGNDLDFVGKQENLTEDLIKALTLAGEDFNEKVIRDMGHFNTKESWGYKKKDFSFDLNRKYHRKLMKSERWITEKFYKK